MPNGPNPWYKLSKIALRKDGGRNHECRVKHPRLAEGHQQEFPVLRARLVLVYQVVPSPDDHEGPVQLDARCVVDGAWESGAPPPFVFMNTVQGSPCYHGLLFAGMSLNSCQQKAKAN